MERFQRDAASVVERYAGDLTQEERRALEQKDLRALSKTGILPLFLLIACFYLHKPFSELMSLVNEEANDG
jgi:hypothetical protein